MDSSDSAGVTIARPSVADLGFIMTAERTEGFEKLVGRSDDAWHRSALADPRYAYFLARSDEPLGFVILRDWNAPEQVTHIKRIVITKPGQGVGKAFLNLILDEVFGTTQAYRLSLGVFPHNLRARRAYEGVGFKSEGVSRGSAFFGGVNHDELVMAMLKPEWRALRDSG
jgi:RimJ/RimL family protein N-acetyltransferase